MVVKHEGGVLCENGTLDRALELRDGSISSSEYYIQKKKLSEQVCKWLQVADAGGRSKISKPATRTV